MPLEAAEDPASPQVAAPSHPHHPRDRVVATVLAFEAVRGHGVSQRQFARETKVPRTTLQGWLAAKARLDDDPAVVAFFESPAGLRVLHRLLLAALFVMTLVGACGLRQVRMLLDLAGLSPWLACSYATLRRRAAALEADVVQFAQDERQRLATTMPPRAITTCQDETFHPQPCLVAIEPVSDFILLERYAAGRDERTWTTAMAAAVQDLPITIAQVASDEARGLRKHVRDALGAHPSPDVFHVQYEVQRGTGAPLAAQTRRAQEALADAREAAVDARAAAATAQAQPRGPGRPKDWPAHVAHAEAAERAAATALMTTAARHETMRAQVRGLGTTYHPFDLATGAPRPAAMVATDLGAHFDRIEDLATEAALPARCLARIAKARRVVPGLVATIAWVHRTVTACVTAAEALATVHAVLQTVLIPALYLRRVAARTAGAAARAALRARADALVATLATTAAWTALPPPLRVQAWQLAQHCADWFQRASSCVEGRNGHLSLRHHHLHRLSARKLGALTAVHNYVLRRPDGTTAAERFFGAPPADLFEHLCLTLALPARPRNTSRHAGPERLAATG